MKKMMCVVLALLCMTAGALAESVPSKNTADMVIVTVDQTLTPNIPADSGFAVTPVLEEDALHAVKYADHIMLCKTEIAKLAEAVGQRETGAESSAVEAYFGEIRDSAGNAVTLSEALDAQTLNVNELMPLAVSNYDPSYGNVTLSFQFKTPYAQDEAVLVLIGIQNAATEAIEWTAFEGVGTGEEGAVQVAFTPEILEAIQNNVALIAVVSAGEAANP